MCTTDKKSRQNRRNTVILFVNNTGLKQGDFLSAILLNLVLQKVIQSIKKVPSAINIGKEQLNVLAYPDDK